jgi:hypothetical protein
MNIFLSLERIFRSTVFLLIDNVRAKIQNEPFQKSCANNIDQNILGYLEQDKGEEK